MDEQITQAADALASTPTAIGTARTATSQSTELYDLLKVVVTDVSLSTDEKKILIDELRKSTPASDRWTFRWAIWILGVAVLLTILALWNLSFVNMDIPDGLVAIGSAAAGGLAGLLTPSRRE
ncbi:hypothetical protein thsps21_17370 [Pseudomonas sp. No.21]|jgi:hypothetical protein|uniref:hypothetical protein n=1 Tax=Pseudomonas TaxID=286 RepID=UPI000DAA8CC8|nr:MULTISPECIES: hypothetical protein [Pseudomonas]MDW3716573.1 hypothetical protein [Pseudomonas sp. 2023EL-01195]PZE12173.1 hypothetical protein DMX10_17110 [Pseudomonas sp. 57B-090624]GJN47689.1 hypothetical protein TUM20249_36750 [Pseudomonas tohonis]